MSTIDPASQPGNPLTDHRTRAARDLGCDLAVTAGAGAGKTTVLVDRFVHIARDPQLGPDRILAITFTRKAAAEMKERAIRVFEQAGEVELRRRTEAAYISTIHGFAERVLRERPFDARIDPAFTVLTEYDQARFLQEALQTMYARNDLRAFAPRLGKDRDGGWSVFSLVREVARLLREGPAAARREADVVDDDVRCIELGLERGRERVHRMEARMLDSMRELLPILGCATFKSRGVKHQTWRAYVDALSGCLEGASARAAVANVWRATTFTSEIPLGEREPIRALLDRIKALAPTATFDDWAAQEALERELLPLKRAVYAAAAAITRTYADHKRRRGAMDFHDLQLRAAALFADNAGIRGEYADRFRHILLDESQDTDELQYGIVQSLRTETNTLFMVGDPKQAIYEFRGANPDVFHAALGRLPDQDRLQLPENFRSRPEIISFVNGIGGALLGEQFVNIVARADYGGQWLRVPAVTALYAVQQQTSADGERSKRYEPVSDARPREAAAVAEEIVALLREAPLVRDPESRELRWVPLRPKHVAILFRTRTAIPYFERSLAARGIPYVTAAGQGFYERAEVLDCMMLLRVLAQPLDDLAMAAVLRSPIVGATDADLWRLRSPATADHNRRRPRALYRSLRDYAPLTDFYTRFKALRRRTRGVRAAEAFEDALRTFGYDAALAAHQDGAAMLANLAKLRRQLRDSGAMSPLEAYAELERTRELMPKEGMAPLVGAADDVVVLTTIHDAKGLEWPVVCLPNLQATPAGGRAGFSARGGVLLCDAIGADEEPVRPLSLHGIDEELGTRGEAEERRLLYVALTRSRERLILSACVKPEDLDPKPTDSYTTPLPFLLLNTAGTLAAEGEHDCGSYRTQVRHITGPVEERTLYQGGASLAEGLAPALVATTAPEQLLASVLPLSLKVTELLSYRRCPLVYRFSHMLEISENLAHRAAVRGQTPAALSAVELGTIVHAMLERARFDATDRDGELARLLDGQPAAYHAALRRMLEPVLCGEIGTAARDALRVEREWPFAVRVGGVLIEGVIDLAIQGRDGRWTVVDYKSNDFSRLGRLEYLVDYYTPQLELYALALSQAGIGAVAECALVLLTGPVVHRWAFDAAASQVGTWSEEMVARIAAGDYITSAGPKCERCGYRKRKVCKVGQGWSDSSQMLAGSGLPVG